MKVKHPLAPWLATGGAHTGGQQLGGSVKRTKRSTICVGNEQRRSCVV